MMNLPGLQDLLLVSTPAYDPDRNRIEMLWRELRRAVTHNHRRQTLTELLDDAQVWIEGLSPSEVLQHRGSPSTRESDTPEDQLDAA